MPDERVQNRFPHVYKVLNRLEASNHPGWIKVFGFAILGILATAYDFPGAIIKGGKEFKRMVKKPPSI